MGKDPAVSVVLIFLDAERFLAEAVASVQTQAFADWELLLVDDGSTDAGSTMARALAAGDPARIRYIEHEGHRNRGMSASRNAGIAAARAPLVAFIDSDDVWVPGKLAEQVAIMNANPRAGMVFGATRYWHGWTGRDEDIARDHVWRFDFQAATLVRPPFLLFVAPLGPCFTPSMSNIMVRREALAAIGGFEESFAGVREDTVFFTKAFYNLYAYHADAPWDWYRQHDASSQAAEARKPRAQRRRERVEYCRWLLGYFAGKRTVDPMLLQRLAEVRQSADHPILFRLRPAYWREKWYPVMRAIARKRLSPAARRRVHAARRSLKRGTILWRRLFPYRSLHRVVPTHRDYGFEYGTPVDRYYIEHFLETCRDDVKGHVLEIGCDEYTRRFGGDKVVRSDVLHAIEKGEGITLVADLTDAPQIPDGQFDCVIFTQTMQCIYDYRAALRTLLRILKPGGVVLATMPGVASQISRGERPFWGEYWRWTSMAAERVFAETFPQRLVRVEPYGNVLISIALLDGLVIEELRERDFEYFDPEYELVLGIRAEKPRD